MRKIVLFVFFSILIFSNVSHSNDYEKQLIIIKHNAGTGENGLPKDMIALLDAKDNLAILGRKNPKKVVPEIINMLNPDWKYTKRGWAYRIALLEVLTGIGNKVPKKYLPILQGIVNDENEKNDFVKMQASTAIYAINSIENNEYRTFKGEVISEGEDRAKELFENLSAVKYRDMKESMGLEELVKKGRDLPKDMRVKLARIMIKDEDVFAQYQGAIILHHMKLNDEAREALIQVLENVYKSGDERAGRIVYSMIHVFDDDLLNDLFIDAHTNMLQQVDGFSDEMVEKVYKTYAIKDGTKLKDTIEEKKQGIKAAMRAAIEKMRAKE